MRFISILSKPVLSKTLSIKEFGIIGAAIFLICAGSVSTALASSSSGGISAAQSYNQAEYLYTVSVPVKNHQQALLKPAIDNAFQKVVNRVTMTVPLTGASSNFFNDVQARSQQIDFIKFAHLDAQQFVASYSYQQEASSPNSLSDLNINQMQNDLSEEKSGLVLKVQFDGHSLNQALISQNIPIVGENRPSVLMLVNVSDINDAASSADSSSGANSLNMVSEHWGLEHLQTFADAASVYGIPLVFPTMDLADMQVLTPDIVWQSNNNIESLRPLLKRYNPHAILVGRVNVLSNGEWFADWQLSFGEAQYQWSFSAANSQEMAEQLMQKLSVVYKSLFAISDESEQVISLEIIDVADLSEFANVIHYLRSLDIVSSATTEYIDASEVKLNVSVMGDPQGLIDVLNLNGKLQQVDSDFSGELPTIVYQWRENK